MKRLNLSRGHSTDKRKKKISGRAEKSALLFAQAVLLYKTK